jgi:hypothetical protein
MRAGCAEDQEDSAPRDGVIAELRIKDEAQTRHSCVTAGLALGIFGLPK